MNLDDEKDELLQTEIRDAMNELEIGTINPEETNDLINSLNDDQKRVFYFVQKELRTENEKRMRHFVSGAAGTGKSRLIKTIKAYTSTYLQMKVAITAPTDLSAFNVEGMTVYRLLQLPVEHGHCTSSHRPLSSNVLKTIRHHMKDVVLLIIDEISMISNITLLDIHLRLCEIYNTADRNDGWFGRLHIIVFGDLLQLPPPVNEGSPAFVRIDSKLLTECTDSTRGTTNLWQYLFTYDELTQNTRQKSDPIYAGILERLRVNDLSSSDIDVIKSKQIKFKGYTKKHIIGELYELINKLPRDALVLLPTKKRCAVLNAAILFLLPTENVCLAAIDSVNAVPNMKTEAIKKLSSLDNDSSRTFGLEKLIIIKINCKIMLLRNIDVVNGLVNGAIGTVIDVKNALDMRPEKIVVQFGTKAHDIERVSCKYEVLPGAYIFRKQFPICVAYGITIHKSQGMSLNNCIMDVGNTVFTCGQTYVALSRVSSLNGLYLINFDPSKIKSQTSAIKEYNRLRRIYRPDLNPIRIHLKNNVFISDLKWTDFSDTSVKNTGASQHLPISDVTGFINSDGISCYVNSILQVLFNCCHILNHIINDWNSSELQNLAFSFLSNDTQLNSANMRRSLGRPFSDNRQQDVVEFIGTLFQAYKPIQSYFRHQIDVTLTCSRCYSMRVQSTHNNIIHLGIPKDSHRTTIPSLFNNFLKPVEISAIRCPSCNTCCTHNQTIKITNTNQYIFLQVLLWSNNYQNKINDLIINHVPTTKLKINSNYYQVHSVICHHGKQMTDGHYTSLIRHQNKWLRCNDTQISHERWPWGGKDVYIITMEKIY